MRPLEFRLRDLTDARMASPRVVPAFEEIDHAHASFSLARKALAHKHLAFQRREGAPAHRVGVSVARPVPIEGRTPAFLQPTPNAIEIYRAP